MIKPTRNIAEWRAIQQQAHQITLQSGLIVTARRVTALQLVYEGRLPLPLADRVWTMIRNVAADAAALKENAPVLNAVCQALIESPPITAEKSDDPESVWVEELPIDDRIDLYIWAQQGVAPFASFPLK